MIVRLRACSKPQPGDPQGFGGNALGSLGLIVVGDFALATGADRHVAFAAAQVGAARQSIAWAWFVAADRVQLAAALYEAWQRPHAVACFGGLGQGADDCVLATINALQIGREQVGLPRHQCTESEGVTRCANIAFFPGHPKQAHPAFSRWWRALAETGRVDAPASEQVRWVLPEPPHAVAARHSVKASYPTVAQTITASGNGNGELMLTFTGTSKGKAQGARKALQRALAASGR